MRWANSDFYSFGKTMEVEAHVVENDLNAYRYGARLVLGQCVTDWRRALPYNEAERRLLYDVGQIDAPGVWGFASEIRQSIKHEVIVDAGVERVVDGNELMQRWWKWRRGVDQFAGQNGPERAATAMRKLLEGIQSA